LNINVTFPRMPCAILSLDIVDVTGVHMVNLDGRIHKHSLNKDGGRTTTQDAVSYPELTHLFVNRSLPSSRRKIRTLLQSRPSWALKPRRAAKLKVK
jgi:hypothetical protein